MTLTAVLRRMKRDDITVHGFRSSFRDWAAEATDLLPGNGGNGAGAHCGQQGGGSLSARGHAGKATSDDAGVGRALAVNTVQWLLDQPTRIHSLDGIFLGGYI